MYIIGSRHIGNTGSFSFSGDNRDYTLETATESANELARIHRGTYEFAVLEGNIVYTASLPREEKVKKDVIVFD